MKNIEEWYKIGNTLCDYFGICRCQRKLKTIVDNLVSIYEKSIGAFEGTHERDFTGAEWLLLAILNSKSTAVMHGINCEYPIINKEDDFWKWILEIKDSPYLEDN
jgi:hypothetical protein